MREQFVLPAKLKNVSLVLLGVGVLALLIGIFALNGEEGARRFWGVLLFDSVFFLVVTAAMGLLLSAATLAAGSWHIAYRRVMESMVMALPVLGILAFIVLMIIVWGDKHFIYEWVDKHVVAEDPVLQKKSVFLNPGFFTLMTVLTIGLWSFLGYRLRRLSLQEDLAQPGTRKIYWKTLRVAAAFVAVFAVTNSSSSWQWIMSTTPHWYSTLFAWYIFASSLVCSIAVLALFVVLMRNLGFMEWITDEHLHDLGKLMFAFSIFWTYLWFAQYMLIWYGNIPEETTYFSPRLWGSYRPIFLLNIIINFVTPFLLLMTRDAKRNYTSVAVLAFIIVIGHMLDFYMMFMPQIVKDNWHLGWFELGITLGYAGLMILLVTRSLAKAPLYPKNHPFLKETLIHHS
ncbi:quinol:cytochrome C oxidoreductase [Compostibacter hankyongensis]|uniref:Quinol:cytochrome C oxidoreductase n=1 Tax=Compostibacter hankyongensis TaxID=1007089 RepID=A0ABP8FDU2_9BACT